MATGGFHSGGDRISENVSAYNTGADVSELQERHETLRQIVERQGAVIAEHQGNLKGVFPAISAVQSSFALLLTVAGAIASVLLGLMVFNLTRTNAVGDRLSDQNARLGGMEVRLGTVEGQLQLLPERVAQQVRAAQAPAPPPQTGKPR